MSSRKSKKSKKFEKLEPSRVWLRCPGPRSLELAGSITDGYVDGTNISAALVHDVVRRMSVVRAMERFSICESDVHAAVAYRNGYAKGFAAGRKLERQAKRNKS